MQWLNNTGQPLIQVLEACQVVQRALVNAQGTRSKCIAWADFDQSPASQGGIGRQRTPVRFGERGKGKTKGWIGPQGVALRGSTQRSESGVKLFTFTHEQYSTLKW